MKTDTTFIDIEISGDRGEIPASWLARRPCSDCGDLELAVESPMLPETFELAVYLLDDAMLQGPHRPFQLFVCQSCGSRWQYDHPTSRWDRQI